MIKIGLAIIILLIISSVGFFVLKNYCWKEQTYLTTGLSNKIILVEKLDIFDKVEVEHIVLYLEIAENIALAREYDLNKYNCWDYATDLKRALIKVGYNNTKIAMGMFDDYPHAWVEVNGIWIEATIGEIILKNNSNYKFGYYGTEKYNPYG